MAAASDKTSQSGLGQVFQRHQTLMRKEAFEKAKWSLELTATGHTCKGSDSHTWLLRGAPSQTSSWVTSPRLLWEICD